MGWLQLETSVGQSEPGILEAELEKLGAISITLRDAGDEPLLEPAPGETPLWSSTRVSALFPDDAEPEKLSAALHDLIDASELNYTRIEDIDWQTSWQQRLSARRFGERLWVVPHDHEQTPAGSAVVRLEPGLAFGTGEHATTALCLEWLDANIREGDRVLDYGCGSGVLAIAALALGAASVCAVDIDTQALDATRNNAINNGCDDRLRAVHPNVVDNSQRFDVLVANIVSGTLIELGTALEGMMRPGARLASAGILAHQADDIAAAWSGWANMRVTQQRRNWVLMTGTKLKSSD
ncbi:MAG: 50S ribosomal protein L11 methyltransferase [Gammaproteobacteria bacterium]|nr:50S ribosomal protein L11 methyltransferase [Gammaproteobacteria bacterium]MDP6617202.1 50S ribosomal protein L11 methyltransferase [Gammaproteobacteria bacterium]MDP6695411.1 50S ribosomal protein L11 methyltransferase [Gammaproteobacteria bacterium]MDP7042118.1 50S ribosomal protein L11 methyltransferase [Gammaproteobacteria bacterium]